MGNTQTGRGNGSRLTTSKLTFVTLDKGFPEDGGQPKRVTNNMILPKKETLCRSQWSSHIIDYEDL